MTPEQEAAFKAYFERHFPDASLMDRREETQYTVELFESGIRMLASGSRDFLTSKGPDGITAMLERWAVASRLRTVGGSRPVLVTRDGIGAPERAFGSTRRRKQRSSS